MPQEAHHNPPIEKNSFNVLNLAFPALLLAFLIIPQIATQILLSRGANDPHIISIIGRQQTLSQNISKTALKLQVATNDEIRNQTKKVLAALLDTFEKSQIGLQYGDAELSIPFQSNSKEVGSLYAAIVPAYDAILTAGRCLVTSTASNCNSLSNSYVNVILGNENSFLDGMNQISLQYETETNNRLSQAKLISFVVLLVILLLFAVSSALLFRPIAERQAETVEELKRSRISLQAAVLDSEARSTELQTVVDVGTQVSTILEVDRLLRDVSDLTKERLRLYHSHIYLLNDTRDTLVLTA
nr:hypothetical protein [Anaerolineae bacterium]